MQNQPPKTPRGNAAPQYRPKTPATTAATGSEPVNKLSAGASTSVAEPKRD
jgi:hypothetical protein